MAANVQVLPLRLFQNCTSSILSASNRDLVSVFVSLCPLGQLYWSELMIGPKHQRRGKDTLLYKLQSTARFPPWVSEPWIQALSLLSGHVSGASPESGEGVAGHLGTRSSGERGKSLFGCSYPEKLASTLTKYVLEDAPWSFCSAVERMPPDKMSWVWVPPPILFFNLLTRVHYCSVINQVPQGGASLLLIIQNGYAVGS